MEGGGGVTSIKYFPFIVTNKVIIFKNAMTFVISAKTINIASFVYKKQPC